MRITTASSAEKSVDSQKKKETKTFCTKISRFADNKQTYKKEKKKELKGLVSIKTDVDETEIKIANESIKKTLKISRNLSFGLIENKQ